MRNQMYVCNVCPDTVERRGMGSHRHRRVEMDGTAEWRGMAPAPQTGEGLPRPSTAERWRDGNVPIP